MSNHHQHHTSRRVTIASVVAGLVLAAGALGSSQTYAGPVEDVEQSCRAGASGSPDSLERWSEHCAELAGEFRDAYHVCMHDAPGHADSLERWVDHCTADATLAVEGN